MKKRVKKSKRKKSFVNGFLLLGLFLIILGLNFYNFFLLNSKPVTGNDISAIGYVSFEILGNPEINITHPLNQSYDFDAVGPLGPFDLDLNVTSSVPISSWVYSLYDLRHNVWTYPDVAFLPNSSLPAVRWGNHLFVNATTLDNDLLQDDVVFFVWVNNTAPILGDIKSTLYFCEGDEVDYKFNATDYDEDILVADLNPKNPFFKVDRERNAWGNMSFFSIIAVLDKQDVGGVNHGSRTYGENIVVTDGVYSDFVNSDFVVIEKNNILEINSPNGLTAKTVWTQGENSSLFYWINVSDMEYNLGYGDFTYNLNIENSTGFEFDFFDLEFVDEIALINFTADETIGVGVYDVEVCVEDTGILNPHAMIEEICNQTGEANLVCDIFQLTITNQNRAPTIVEHYPLNDSEINVSGTVNIYFNVTEYDPDWTLPDTYWYVDDVLKEFDEGNLTDEFVYSFGCGVSGEHKVEIVATDGELNDSVVWNVNVEYVACSSAGSSGGGGGGGGGGSSCVPNWVCTSWDVCQNAETSLEAGLLSGLDYRLIQNNCSLKQITDERCGFQSRECYDLNKCGMSFDKPGEFQDCLYIENPSCSDGVKNCHDGACEVLVDCGGPCDACPTCSDGIKNQGEEGIDCGGPCPWKCPVEIPLLKRSEVIYGFLGLLLLIIIFIIVKLVKVLRYKKMIGQNPKI